MSAREKQQPMLWRILYIVALRAIWLQRNQAVFENASFSSHSVIGRIKSAISELIEEDFTQYHQQNSRFMEDKWGTRGVIWDIKNNRVQTWPAAVRDRTQEPSQ
jgi:hypothetical protein